MDFTNLKGIAVPPIAGLFDSKKSIQIDLESFLSQNPEIPEDQKVNKAVAFIKNQKLLNDAEIAFGGYFEKRSWYQRSDLFGSKKDSFRNIHIGIDVWVDEGTEVFVPLDAVVHSFKNNKGKGNYGPTIILKHQTEGQRAFYTLYGHLSKESLKKLKVNQSLKKGEVFAHIGNKSENGEWPPHLHFQLITDLQAYEGDFPGVISENDVDFFKKICPSPYDLFIFPK
ncbi:MAG: peptidase M23 [Chitinophagaceae bacterium]|nr:MAG: peptidase M23 [Chitinophagaceae bacterium]